MERSGVKDLLSTMTGGETPTGEASNPGDNGNTPKIGESIFSQLLQRLLAGRGVKLSDEAEGSGSLEILLENSLDAVLLLDQAGVVIEANPAFCQVYGWSRSELAGSSILSLVPEESWPSFTEKLVGFSNRDPDAPLEGEDNYLDFKARAKNGELRAAECLLSPFWAGGERRILAVFRELPKHTILIEQLKESKDHYLALSETITEAILRLDENFNIIFANSGVKNTFGFDRDELLKRKFSVLFPQEVFAKHREEFRKYFIVDDQDRLAHGLMRTIEILGVTKNRGVTPMEMSFGNSRDFSGRTLTCIIRDISQRKTMERRLRHLAFHDKLTGLGNRDLFNEDMQAFLRDSILDGGRKAALLFLDLDGFKHVNDTHGHSAGDELLVETARRIRVCLRDSDSAYRFGGDEFVAFLQEVGDAQRAVAVAERILNAVRLPYEVTTDTRAKARVEIGVSIGVAVMPEHGADAEAATKSADIAMYFSKEAGKNRITLYDEALSTKSNESWKVEQDIRSALMKGEFELHYQPIVATSGRLLGVEALIRWKRAGATFMKPSNFIPIAEQNGMIIPLGAWVFRRAFIDLRRLERAGYGKIYLSVNVSGKQFEQPDFVRVLSDAIDKGGIDASRINLELTETTLMKSADVAVAKILEIKRRYPAIMISIDDFGTGYSSLSYLSRLPVDVLKIDISFVRALHDEQNRKVVNSILSLADSLGIDVVAEGIETAAQRSYFHERKCYGLQGHLFMKAQPIAELERRFAALRSAVANSSGAKAAQDGPPAPGAAGRRGK
jgi:diguanylate cyclase (GGDEF)-like protein/PAS domain S-box-containing protein